MMLNSARKGVNPGNLIAQNHACLLSGGRAVIYRGKLMAMGQATVQPEHTV